MAQQTPSWSSTKPFTDVRHPSLAFSPGDASPHHSSPKPAVHRESPLPRDRDNDRGPALTSLAVFYTATARVIYVLLDAMRQLPPPSPRQTRNESTYRQGLSCGFRLKPPCRAPHGNAQTPSKSPQSLFPSSRDRAFCSILAKSTRGPECSSGEDRAPLDVGRRSVGA